MAIRSEVVAVGGRGGCVRVGVFHDLHNTLGGDVTPFSTAEEVETAEI